MTCLVSHILISGVQKNLPIKSQKSESAGERVRRVRKMLGMTQEEFAAAIETERTFVSKVESGKSRPSHAMLDALRQKYGVSLDWLIDGSGTWKMAGAIRESEVTFGNTASARGKVEESPTLYVSQMDAEEADRLVARYAPQKKGERAPPEFGYRALLANTKIRLHAARDQGILREAPNLMSIIEEDNLWLSLGDIKGWEFELLRIYLEDEGDRPVAAWFEVLRVLRWSSRRVTNSAKSETGSVESRLKPTSKSNEA